MPAQHLSDRRRNQALALIAGLTGSALIAACQPADAAPATARSAAARLAEATPEPSVIVTTAAAASVITATPAMTTPPVTGPRPKRHHVAPAVPSETAAPSATPTVATPSATPPPSVTPTSTVPPTTAAAPTTSAVAVTPTTSASPTSASPSTTPDPSVTATAGRTPAALVSVPATGGTGSAAERYGWGTPVRSDDFTDGLGPGWGVYDGPGHVGNGRRSPRAVTVTGGVMTFTGTPDGTTAGMAWNPGQKYGRWEARIAAPVADPTYHAVALLWPDAENWPVGGEVDFMENSDPQRQNTELFLHYGAGNEQIGSNVDVDATQWHDWAVEWTPDRIVAYVDGVEWFRTTDRSKFPPGPMHLCLQLDWFPDGGSVTTSTMSVDWVRQYAL